MSKLGCACGHIIRDQTDGLPYKASLLRDTVLTTFFDWLAEETQSYVVATETGAVDAWLSARGYGAGYIALNLSHGQILHDHIHTQYILAKRDMYECTNCGRVHVETSQPNAFVSYSPDNLSKKGLLDESL